MERVSWKTWTDGLYKIGFLVSPWYEREVSTRLRDRTFAIIVDKNNTKIQLQKELAIYSLSTGLRLTFANLTLLLHR